MPAYNTCERHVGRLLEIRIEAGCQNTADVTAIFAAIQQETAQLSDAQSLVAVSDWRKCTVMAEDAASHVIAGMRRANPRIERIGALLPSSSIAMLQFVRMVREGNSSRRKGFKDPEALIAWLSEVLTAEEASRLRAFVG
jgi:hypothetical protein